MILIRALKTLWQEVCTLVVVFWSVLLKHRWKVLITLLVATGIALAMLPVDQAWLEQLQKTDDETLNLWARQISYWGDFPTGMALVCCLTWFLGYLIKKHNWRQLALACLISAAIAGIFVNCFRLTLGRPRPSAEIADGFYGLQKSPQFHGFPSGHSATAYGFAGVLAVAYPLTAVPALVIATSIPWSRMQLNRHYPSDVWLGGITGLTVGVLMGFAVRKNRSF